MIITEKTINNFEILSIKGILNASSAPQLRNHIEQSPENQSLVIDLGQVDFLDSSGLGVLVRIARKKKNSGALLRLANLNERIKTVFELTNAYTLFDIFDDVAKAVI